MQRSIHWIYYSFSHHFCKMRGAIAASRKIHRSRTTDTSKSNNNGSGAVKSGARQKSANHKQQRNTRSNNSSTIYAPEVKTAKVYESTDLLLPSTSTMPSNNEDNKVKEKRGEKGVKNPLINSLSNENVKDKNSNVSKSPSNNAKNGGIYISNQKKLVQSTNLSRTTSSLNSKAGSTATTFGQNSRVGGTKTDLSAITKKRYYAKAIAIMSGGGAIFAIGLVFAGLYFAGFTIYQIVGPICLAIGLLLFVCGIVWIPIIKSKLKRQQQIMSRTFSL